MIGENARRKKLWMSIGLGAVVLLGAVAGLHFLGPGIALFRPWSVKIRTGSPSSVEILRKGKPEACPKCFVVAVAVNARDSVTLLKLSNGSKQLQAVGITEEDENAPLFAGNFIDISEHVNHTTWVARESLWRYFVPANDLRDVVAPNDEHRLLVKSSETLASNAEGLLIHFYYMNGRELLIAYPAAQGELTLSISKCSDVTANRESAFVGCSHDTHDYPIHLGS